jgi:ferrous iron transport protein B
MVTMDLRLQQRAELQEASYLGQIGRLIEPAMQPLGFDWKMGVSIFTGLAAKEIVVSSMGILYHADLNADENSSSLKEKLQQQTYTSGPYAGKKVFTPLIAYAFMIFVLVYFPCVAVLVAIKREGGWKFAVFSMVYNTLLAWVLAFLIVQVGRLF